MKKIKVSLFLLGLLYANPITLNAIDKPLSRNPFIPHSVAHKSQTSSSSFQSDQAEWELIGKCKLGKAESFNVRNKSTQKSTWISLGDKSPAPVKVIKITPTGQLQVQDTSTGKVIELSMSQPSPQKHSQNRPSSFSSFPSFDSSSSSRRPPSRSSSKNSKSLLNKYIDDDDDDDDDDN